MPRTRPISSPCRASQRPCAPRAAVTLGASEATRVRADCASPRIEVSDPAARPNDSAACAKGSGFHRHTSLQVTIGSLPSYKRARPAASPRPGPGGRQRLSPTRHRLVIGLMNRRQGAHATADAPIAATHRRTQPPETTPPPPPAAHSSNRASPRRPRPPPPHPRHRGQRAPRPTTTTTPPDHPTSSEDPPSATPLTTERHQPTDPTSTRQDQANKNLTTHSTAPWEPLGDPTVIFTARPANQQRTVRTVRC